MGDQRAYLFTADTTQASFSTLLSRIDSAPAITNWQKILPGAAILISGSGFDGLSRTLQGLMPGQRYLLVELARSEKDGWLPRKVWDFMNEPTPA